jgi:NADH dehydrogenase FAD-containing subunit
MVRRRICIFIFGLLTFTACTPERPGQNAVVANVVQQAVQQEAKQIAANIAANLQNEPKKPSPTATPVRQARVDNKPRRFE